ncbi:TetR family transcriptional regulator [Streptomyces sp. NPDC093252]|uniref:TetR family transcriptional regulator n=1 Tax=Streptomyces sp. NPDC093252 TaxID=3154980 RepID=UPI003443CB43
MDEAGSPRTGRAKGTTRPRKRTTQRVKDSAATRDDIFRAASKRFAERGFAHVTLQEIADDAGVTPALVNRYFVSKRALFELVGAQAQERHPYDWDPKATPEEMAERFFHHWRDPAGREPALALVRSIDLDNGALLRRELIKRIREPARDRLEGDPHIEAKTRVLESLVMGFGLFGTGALVGEEYDEPSPEDDVIVGLLGRMIRACLED